MAQGSIDSQRIPCKTWAFADKTVGLQAVCLPKEVAVVHCPAYRKSKDNITLGTFLADKTAKTAALEAPDVDL